METLNKYVIFAVFVTTELLTVFKLVLIVVALVLTEFNKLLTVFKFVLIVVAFVLTEFNKLLILVIFVAFVPTELLTVFRLLLVVTRELLIAKTAPVLEILVSKEPSPICCP